MKFLEPQWLWGLLVVPIFYFLILLDEKRRKEQFRRFADQSLWKFLAPELNFGLRFRKSLMSILALAFGLLALARPQWGSHEETIEVTGLDVVLVLDVSSSMWTEDVVPSRLQKMKHWVRNLLSSLEGDRVGVVAFAASTAVVCPDQRPLLCLGHGSDSGPQDDEKSGDGYWLSFADRVTSD